MDQETMTTLAKFGAVAALGLSAFGSALGCGTAGMAAIGAWKKAYLKGKNALFTLLIFVGAPIAQTIYGMLLMMYILGRIGPEGSDPTAILWPAYLGVGIFGGLGIAISAWFVGKSAANGCNALGETGKGLVNYLMVLGVGETVALFVMVFSMMLISM